MSGVFLTVGSQMPFDRLVCAVAAWSRTHPEVGVTAQIGESTLSEASLQGLRCRRMLSEGEFRSACQDARLIVGHAGMGTVLTALELQRPLVVLPRRGQARETRNDHQVDTAAWLEEHPLIRVAWDEQALPQVLDRAWSSVGVWGAHAALSPVKALSPHAQTDLVGHLRRSLSAQALSG